VAAARATTARKTVAWRMAELDPAIAPGKLASRQAGNWLLTAPRDGLRLFDRSTGQSLICNDGWKRPVAPAVNHGRRRRYRGAGGLHRS